MDKHPFTSTFFAYPVENPHRYTKIAPPKKPTMTNIVVVDDEPDAGDLYRQQFRKEVKAGSMHLHVALSGFAALDLLEGLCHEKPLIILSDINMPGMSGIELLKKIKERWPEMRVIMVSAYAGNENYQRDAETYGASDFLSKPMDFDMIKSKIFA